NIPVPTSKNSAYYKRENNIGNTEDLIRILHAAPELKAFKTEKAITFNNIPLMEISFQKLKENFGNPAYVFNNEQLEGHTVIFYRDSVSYYKFLIQYHFINNAFFFAANKISTTGILADSDKKKIIERISKKYLGKGFDEKQGWLIKVTDPLGNHIHTLDDVYFHLYYLAENETTRKLREHHLGEVPEVNEKPSGFKESLDQYI
ncbi:MAG: hypothetical protein P8100_13850, partial [bacterium]